MGRQHGRRSPILPRSINHQRSPLVFSSGRRRSCFSLRWDCWLCVDAEEAAGHISTYSRSLVKPLIGIDTPIEEILSLALHFRAISASTSGSSTAPLEIL